MNDKTPAKDIKAKDLAANVTAFISLLDKIPVRCVRTVLDVRYGLGGWAKALRSRFPTADIYGYEADAETASRAWTDDKVVLTTGEWDGALPPRTADLVTADFNVTTAKRRAELDHLLSVVRPARLIFTDVACVKLHLNFAAYGLPAADLKAYWDGFSIAGYLLVGYARNHWAASTALYEKAPPT